MGAAYTDVGVDRNTIVANAPTAELAIAAPDTFTESSREVTPGMKSCQILH